MNILLIGDFFFENFVYLNVSRLLDHIDLFFFFFTITFPILQGFPGSSTGKESTCNSGDPGSITESGRSAREGIGYRL